MMIAIPKEIKANEYRVSLTPQGTKKLISAGHQVIVEAGAGWGVDFGDLDYQKSGATIVADKAQLFENADVIIKVKEPQISECKMLKNTHVLFSYLHLAVNPEIAQLLLQSGAACIAYETVTNHKNQLPLLQPMSEIAGKMAIQSGAYALEKPQSGSGVLLSGASGVKPAQVLILGGGTVGRNAAKIAVAMGAKVLLLNQVLNQPLKKLQQKHPKLNVALYDPAILLKNLPLADLVVGAVSVPGAKAPKLITRAMLKMMKKGSVLVDVSIDQGGCFETSYPTTHKNPTFVVDDIVHYCVTNIPSAVAQTATLALTNKTLPFILEIANQGYKQAMLNNPNLANGLHILCGKITHLAVAKALSTPYYQAREVLKSF